jgi:hypothetical protein
MLALSPHARKTEKRVLSTEEVLEQDRIADKKNTKHRRLLSDNVSSGKPTKNGSPSKQAVTRAEPAFNAIERRPLKIQPQKPQLGLQNSTGQLEVRSYGPGLTASSPGWTVSEGIGGRFINVDPVYALDER